MPVTYRLCKISKNYFLRSLIKEKVCRYLPDDMGGGDAMKKIDTKLTYRGGGLKFNMSILNGL